MSAGPVDEGKLPNMYHHIICDPDIRASEARATGLLYTAISRATTLGDDDGLNSAIYFQGNNLTRDRIQNVTMQNNNIHEYIGVTRRREWVQYLEQHTFPCGRVDTNIVRSVFNWSKTTISPEKLRARINTYIFRRNNA